MCKYMREKRNQKRLWCYDDQSTAVSQPTSRSVNSAQYAYIHQLTLNHPFPVEWSCVYVSPKPYISHVIRYFATFLRNHSLSISTFEQDPMESSKYKRRRSKYNGYFVYFQEKCNCNLLCGWMMTTTGGKYFYITFFSFSYCFVFVYCSVYTMHPGLLWIGYIIAIITENTFLRSWEKYCKTKHKCVWLGRLLDSIRDAVAKRYK